MTKDGNAPDLNSPGSEPGTQWSEVESSTARPSPPHGGGGTKALPGHIGQRYCPEGHDLLWWSVRPHVYSPAILVLVNQGDIKSGTYIGTDITTKLSTNLNPLGNEHKQPAVE